MVKKTIHGVINGKLIELAEDPGMPSGQEVEVLVKVSAVDDASWGEGLRRCAGALADEWTEEDDRILEALYQERHRDSRELSG